MTGRDSYIIRQKYIDIIFNLSKEMNLSLNESFHKFYQSKVYERISQSSLQEFLKIDEEDFLKELKEEIEKHRF